MCREQASLRARVLPLCALACALACAPTHPLDPAIGRDGGRFVHARVELESRVSGPAPFLHSVVRKRGCAEREGLPLFVFLDGDGASWVRDGRVSSDPTPREPVVLDLMTRDPSCGVYVSRPCVFGLAEVDPRCTPSVWTLDRYSETLVESLAATIDRQAPGRALVLVGWSGGGLIAAHLANRIGRVEAIVTLGANLDLPGWVAHHGYSPALVERSLASPFPLREGVRELHVVARADRVSPPELTRELLGAGASSLLEVAGDHACCWAREWPGIRTALDGLRETPKN